MYCWPHPLTTPTISQAPGGIQQLTDERGVASFQVIAAAIKVAVFSNSDVELNASISDMAVTDLQAEHNGNKIGLVSLAKVSPATVYYTALLTALECCSISLGTHLKLSLVKYLSLYLHWTTT